jgi:predicted site-specific integrase-resolvase
MAETLGLIASVTQVAGAGLALSQTLDQYVDGVATADGMIKNIAKEIRLTSFMIEELGDVFKHDNTSILMSKNAVKAAEETMKECSSVFTEISTVTEVRCSRSPWERYPDAAEESNFAFDDSGAPTARQIQR